MLLRKYAFQLSGLTFLILITWDSAETRQAEFGAKPEDGGGRYFQLGDPITALDFLTTSTTSAFFITEYVIAYLAVQLTWITLHLIFWDSSDTQPDERINWSKQYNFFTNPDRAMENLEISLGQVTSILLLWVLPTMLWDGEPIDETPPGTLEGGKVYPPLVYQEGTLPAALRKVLCPNCVLNIILINTLVLVGFVSTWNVFPYLRRPLGIGPEFQANSSATQTMASWLESWMVRLG